MEPDIKSMLTQKIREVERVPITWNKQEVWMHINSHIKSKRNYRPYCYAAIFLLMLLAANPTVKMHNTHPLKTEIEQVQPGEPCTQPEPAQATTCADRETGDVASFHIRKKDRGVVKNESDFADATSENIPSLSEETTKADISTSVEESIAISEPMEIERIKPIVGVVEWSDQSVASEKPKRKKLLRKLESSDKEWESYSGNDAILFARIK
jgi:hypothetical protein